jgi:predicted RecA/RadA family phage recombinase
MKNFVQNGKQLDVIASAAYKSGELVIEGNLVGVAVADIASGETGAIATEGVYALEKEAAAALIQGDKAYYDAATKKLDATNTNPAVGYVVAVSGNTVHLKISGHKL